MDKDTVLKFLNLIEAENITEGNNEWVKCSCLFARHKHSSGKDKNPSAGVLVKEGEQSSYNCFSCGTHGSLTHIMFELMYLNETKGIPTPYFAQALEFIEDSNTFVYVPKTYEEVTAAKKSNITPYPDTWLATFSSVLKVKPAMKYLYERQVPLQLIALLDPRFDHARQMIGFPYRNSHNLIAGMRGRSINPNVNPKYRHHDYLYDGKSNAGLVWFRESELDQTKPLVVVEGAFDCARVMQYYRNTTAMLGANPTHTKYEFLNLFPEVLWFSDNDKAGNDSFNNAKAALGSSVILKRVSYVEGDVKDPDSIKAGHIKYYLSDFVGLDDFIPFEDYAELL